MLVALGLGSNLGDREAALCFAVRHLTRALVSPLVSSPFESEPRYDTSQPAFLNAAVVGRTRVDPESLFGLAKAIEWAAGRRRAERYGPRPLDIDLLVYGDACLSRPELVLPHPRLREREFVLAPLAEVAPRIAVPPDGATAVALLASVQGRQGVRRCAWSLRCRKVLP